LLVPRARESHVLVFPYSEARGRRGAEDERNCEEGWPNVDDETYVGESRRYGHLFSFYYYCRECAKQGPGAADQWRLIHGMA